MRTFACHYYWWRATTTMSINKRAILSGVLGATASFIGKLALSPDSPIPAALHTICMDTINSNNNDIICPYVSLITRGLCFLCMMGTNSLMISIFLDGMGESGSVVGTSLSTAANFSCSVSLSCDDICIPSHSLFLIYNQLHTTNYDIGNIWDNIL